MTLDHARFQGWLDRYVAARKTYDRDAIADLWSEDAEYRYHPEDEPVRGRDAIVASWLDEPDERGRYDAHYEPLAIDPGNGNHVASGWSRYFDASGQLENEYWNVDLCRFDDEGRCTSFTEWWIQDREIARREQERLRSAGMATLTAEAGDVPLGEPPATSETTA